MNSRIFRGLIFAFAVLLCDPSSTPAQPGSSAPDSINREDHQRARLLIRQLLESHLDVQLRQLEENGLEDRDIFREIEWMRTQLNELAESDMKSILQQLADVDQLPRDKQTAVFATVREQISAVVRRLAVGRQKILKRLKIVELESSLKELIRQQTESTEAIKEIAAKSQREQESSVSQAIEQQRHVKELSLNLIDTLEDLRTWNGNWSTVASDGLRILKVANVQQQLTEAIEKLQLMQLDRAIESQTNIIRVMKKLLVMVNRSTGTLESGDSAQLEQIHRLIESQTAIRDATRGLPESQPPSVEMIEQQSQLHQNIVETQENLPDSSIIRGHAQRAETAAFEAAAMLVDSKPQDAIAEQNQVVENLMAVERTLNVLAQGVQNKSAVHMRRIISKLAAIEPQVRSAQAEYDSLVLTEHQSRNASDVKEVAKSIRSLMMMEELPAPVLSVLTELAEANDDEATALSDAQTEQSADAFESTQKRVRDLFAKAEALIETTLKDMKRQESAIVVGELARAAEILERLAAAEKNVVEDLKIVGKNFGEIKFATVARKTADRHAEVMAIANKLAEATEQTAFAASKQTASIVELLGRARVKLSNVADQSEAANLDQMREMSRSASEACQRLGTAALLTRQQISATATELNQQLASRATDLSSSEKDLADTITRFATKDASTPIVATRMKLSQAIQQQASALGKPDLALTLRLKNMIGEALEVQDVVDSQSLRFQPGNSSEFKILSKQGEVSDLLQLIRDLADQRATAENADIVRDWDRFIQQLNDSHHSSVDAAARMLDGNQRAAITARESVRVALNKASQLLSELILKKMNTRSSAGADGQAQNEVTAFARETEKQSQLSEASKTLLHDALIASEKAQDALRTQPANAKEAQEQALRSLEIIDQQLADELRKAVVDRAAELATRTVELETLAQKTSRIDSTAGDSVRVANEEAHFASSLSQSPHQMMLSADQVEIALLRAGIDLGVSEQINRQHQELAESIVSRVKQQQAAAEIIFQRASVLEQLESSASNAEGSSASRRKTAREMEKAQEQFVEALRTTGRAAVELSGQQEVANGPLRDALTMTANLQPNSMLEDSRPDPMASDQISPETEDDLAASFQFDGPNQSNANDQASPQDAVDREDSAAGKSSQGSKSTRPNDLGTGFVPQSPELTAEMMAGAKAQREAKKSLEPQLPTGKQPLDESDPRSNLSDDGDDGQMIDSENSGESKLSKKDGAATKNQRIKGGVVEKQREGTEVPGMESGKVREKEERITGRRFRDETWFAKLPPDVQRSLRAGTTRKAPRAYEERLKKYFQSVD